VSGRWCDGTCPAADELDRERARLAARARRATLVRGSRDWREYMERQRQHARDYRARARAAAAAAGVA